MLSPSHTLYPIILEKFVYIYTYLIKRKAGFQQDFPLQERIQKFLRNKKCRPLRSGTICLSYESLMTDSDSD